MAFFKEYVRPAKRAIPRRSKNRPVMPPPLETRSESQSQKEGGRGGANAPGADTSIGPHPQVQVNQLDKQLPPTGSPSGFANSVLPWEQGATVEGRALNPRAVLVRVGGKVVGARKNPVQAFSRGLVVGLVREGNEWVVVGRYNRFGQRVFDEHERRKFMEWQWAGGDRQGWKTRVVDGGAGGAVEAGESGQREPGLRGEGEAAVGGAMGGGEGGEGDGGARDGGDPVEAEVGGTGAREGHGVVQDEGGEVKAEYTPAVELRAGDRVVISDKELLIVAGNAIGCAPFSFSENQAEGEVKV